MLGLRQFAVRPGAQFLDLKLDSIHELAPKAELAQTAEVIEDELEIAVEIGDGGAEGGLGEEVRLSAGRACKLMEQAQRDRAQAAEPGEAAGAGSATR